MDAELERWRLILGEAASELGDLGERAAARDAALDWLYGRDESLGRRGIRRAGSRTRGGAGQTGGAGASTLSTPEWIGAVHRLFPTPTIERLERDAVERFRIDDLVTNPEVLRRIEPNQAMLRAVLTTKHLMNQEVLALARQLVNRVIRDLMERLATEVRQAFTGPRSRTPTRVPNSRNLDIRRTLRANLRHFQPDTGKVVIERPYFTTRSAKRMRPWQVVLLVDQSGSMLDSVIHSAVTAACLWGLPGIRTHLVAFDTTVVDLTRDVEDPVELLMKVQLGGGTDIAQAVQYAAGLIDNPRQAIVVLISDLYEGGNDFTLRREVASLVGQGTEVVALAALNDESGAVFNPFMGQQLADLGAHVGAMTPGELAGFLADTIGRS
ncbi:VWA domain-containing protein [Galactobacter sp.]|uniref:VWA domain-containing protein n=1 Tax=Galactobacter sp. TaxID=2676125 RepID=UPI0025C694AB|nr:VWA domain-containing protein [Galactobacter sp.]